jgi:hypothetical protein
MPRAPYPNFEGKHGQEAIFSPAEVVASLAADGPAAPDAAILTYQQSLLDELQARGVPPTGGYPARGDRCGSPAGTAPSRWPVALASGHPRRRPC